MMETPQPSAERKALDVAVMHGCVCSPDRQTCLPAGNCVSRARLRHLRESEWVVVTDDSVPVGLAAYKRADSDVRVVHELLVDRTRSRNDVARITDVLLAALEMMAYDDRVSCLMFFLYSDVATAPLEKHGYSAIAADRGGVWLQKRLVGLNWAQSPSGQPS